MELQEEDYSCGPAALRAVLYVYHKQVSESAVRKWAGTTPKGTDEVGLRRAMAHYGFRAKEFQTSSVREATDWLKKSLRKGVPLILCVDGWDHWIAVVGTLGNKLIIFDPEPPESRKRPKYSGLKFCLASELAERWASLDDEDDTIYYYGMAVVPEKD